MTGPAPTAPPADAPLLVVAHEATRTGGPRVLADLLAAIAPGLGRPVVVRLLAGGPLAEELRQWSDPAAAGRRPAAVLVNSALAAGALADVEPDVPTAVLVHEQGDALAALGPEDRQALVRRARSLLAVSDGVAAGLAALGVPVERISLLPPLVPRPVVDRGGVQRRRDELTAGRRALVVACGVAEWRKGADLAAPLTARLPDDVCVVWAGRRTRAEARRLDADTAAAGVADRLRWLGEVEDAIEVLAAADAVVMPSREDPQPLVPLEAALVGTPTAAFDVGGLAAMGRAGAAATVAFPDVPGLVEAVVGLLADHARADATVRAAVDWWDCRHAPAAVLPRFCDALAALGLSFAAGHR